MVGVGELAQQARLALREQQVLRAYRPPSDDVLYDKLQDVQVLYIKATVHGFKKNPAHN